MFKNRKQELADLKAKHAAGDVFIPTELERIMKTEAKEKIKNHYDNLEGSHELHMLIARSKGNSSLNLLTITQFDKKIKMKELEASWEYTRPWPMMIRLVETFFYVLISQTQTMIYFSMIFSMWANAGIISIFYPIAVFGYAMLEETRPRKEFWDTIRMYTTFILLFKLLLNLQFFEQFLNSTEFKYWGALLKLGVFNYESLT